MMSHEKTLALLFDLVQNPLLAVNLKMFNSREKVAGLEDDEEVLGWITGLAIATEEAIRHLAECGIAVNHELSFRLPDKNMLC